MIIQQIELAQIRMPLKFLFKTSKAAIDYRETIIIKVTDELGNVGYGEVVAFQDPFYTDETLEKSKEVLINEYIPILMGKTIIHPYDLHQWIKPNYPMALAGLENSLMDGYAVRNKQSIMDVVFGEQTNGEIYGGVVLGDLDGSRLLQQIEDYLQEGYSRFKVKIKPEDGIEKLTLIRQHHPHIQLLADANKSYGIGQMDELMKIDQFNLLCIEEPLAVYDPNIYRNLRKEMSTPICLDESILTVEDLEKGIEAQALDVLNVKVGRVGGLYYAKQMIDLCRKHKIDYWIGSMVESGISKILHVHLASLQDTYIPGDLSSSNRYFNQEIIKPEIVVENGKIKVPKGNGLGVTVQEERIKDYTIDYIRFGGGKDDSN